MLIEIGLKLGSVIAGLAEVSPGFKIFAVVFLISRTFDSFGDPGNFVDVLLGKIVPPRACGVDISLQQLGAVTSTKALDWKLCNRCL